MTDAPPPAAQAAQQHVAQAKACLSKFRVGDARLLLERALTFEPDCLEAHLGLSEIRFPGSHYIELLRRLHKNVRPETYVEIGVATGISMAQALPTTRCIGIDPAPTLTVPAQGKPEIFIQTSDDFFAQNDLKALLGGKPLALGFIDGLHLFETVLSDFVNLERYCAPSSALVIHDCIPINALVAARERQTRFWTGDVWRVLPILSRFRPDLSISIIMTPPSGLAVVRKLDPQSDVLVRQREQAIAYGNEVDLSVMDNPGLMGIRTVTGDWDSVAKLFADLIH